MTSQPQNIYVQWRSNLGSTSYQNGVIGETFIMDRCTSNALQILRCHPDDGSDEGLVTLDDDGVTYTVRTMTGVCMIGYCSCMTRMTYIGSVTRQHLMDLQ